MALDNMKVAWLGQPGRERAPFLRHSAGRTRHRLVDRRGGRVCEVLGEIDPDEDDLGLGGAKSFRQGFAHGEHVGAGTRRERHADDAVLEVDEDEGGPGGIETDHDEISRG
jgi:hypothetical protein